MASILCSTQEQKTPYRWKIYTWIICVIYLYYFYDLHVDFIALAFFSSCVEAGRSSEEKQGSEDSDSRLELHKKRHGNWAGQIDGREWRYHGDISREPGTSTTAAAAAAADILHKLICVS